MIRLDLLPDNDIATLLKSIEDQIREFKNKQQYSGTSGMLGYFVSNPGDWDITGSASDTGDDTGYREFEILFTASGEQPFPIENIQLDIRFGGTGDGNKPVEQSNGIWGYSDGVNFAGMTTRNPRSDVSYAGNETQYLWRISFNVQGTLSYYIKAYVSGSSDGTVVVTDVS